MSDDYRAIYDAVRSRISHCDVSAVVADSVRSAFDVGYAIALAQEAIGSIGGEWTRPCVVFKPRLTRDGNEWIACLGDNLQDGVVGCGATPDAAMDAFDCVFWKGDVTTIKIAKDEENARVQHDIRMTDDPHYRDSYREQQKAKQRGDHGIDE